MKNEIFLLKSIGSLCMSVEFIKHTSYNLRLTHKFFMIKAGWMSINVEI